MSTYILENELDVPNYLEEMYWAFHPTIQSECCGEQISDFQSLIISAKLSPSVCPDCGEECSFLVIKGPASRPFSITEL